MFSNLFIFFFTSLLNCKKKNGVLRSLSLVRCVLFTK